jgi:PAS domain S-box-containing protein
VTGPASEIDGGKVLQGAWRRPSLLAVLRLTAGIGTAWLAAVLFATPALIASSYGVATITFVAAIWVASILPFSDGVRFAVIELAYFGVSAVAIPIYALSPGVPVLLGLAILVAAAYYDRKGGMVAGIATLLLLAWGAWGWTTGYFPSGPKVPRLLPSSYDFWIRALFAQILAVCGITGTIVFITRETRNVRSRLNLADEKFAKAFRICPDAMIITDLNSGCFIEVNDSHERITGYTREEVLGKTSVEIGTFRDTADRESFAAPLRATGSVRNVERQIRHRSGRAVDVSYSAECFDLGGVPCAVTVIRDVTDRKRTEAKLVENEERFRSFVENANVGIYRSTPEGRIIVANPALLKLMGYTSFEEMAARNLEGGSYEPSYPRKQFRERLESTGLLNGWEATWTRRDGTTILVRESANVIRGADGNILYYDGMIEDISERKKAEQALRESEERYRQLTEGAFESIVISENGRITDINDQGLRLFGFQREEMIGREIVDFVVPEMRALVAERVKSGSEGVYEHQLLRKDGSHFNAEAQAKMMPLGNRVLRMTAVRDITERLLTEQKQKNLEEQLRQMQKMEALGTLAGGIAHDFNNILTGILGNLELAAMDLPSGHPAYIAVESADKASRRARDLVARILSFSRLEQDNRVPGSLGPIVNEAVQLLRTGLQGIEVHTDIDAKCPSVVFDSGQIHQVLMNLGTNAIHAMGEKGVLTLRLRSVTPSSALRERHPQVLSIHTVCLTLSDSGCGMSEAVMKRIFEPFYTTKTFGHGTGLGLAMVHAIVKSHNGAIVLESTPGVGTTFDLYFPAAVEPPPAPAAVAKRTRRDGFAPFGNGRGIMLVDDEEAVRTIASALLERFGFTPHAYARPAEALEAFRAAPASFSVVISDLTMPEMNGLELARHILAIRPDTPVILTSGYLHAEAQRKARESGVKSVIKKPFEIQELVAQIRSVLNEKENP